MSLKAEQKILGSQITDFEPTVYTTGAHLIPLKIIINGIEKYVWVVNEFDNDTFLDGKNCSVTVIADNKNNLIIQS
ncbi:MAG: hypothetical protein V1872_00885 [bacterium]